MNNPDIKTEIMKYLEQYKEPIKRDFIRKHLFMKGYDIGDSVMRKICQEMVIKDRLPLGSDESGYYIIRNEMDLLKAMNFLDEKSRALAIRRNCLREAVENYWNKGKIQRELAI